MGGNDLQFKERIEHCANPIINCSEEVGYLSSMLTKIDNLKPDLTTVLTKIRERASSARIVLTGYARQIKMSRVARRLESLRADLSGMLSRYLLQLGVWSKLGKV